MELLGTALVLAQADPSGDPMPAEPFNLFGSMWFPLVLGFVFVWLFLIRPQRKEEEKKRNLLEALKKNDRVVTTGGMYGTIVNIKDDEVTLRVDDQAKVRIRFARQAIARVVSESTPSEGSVEDGSKKS